MQQDIERVYDVAIIGGGIGGTTLATILARHGVKVLLVEGGDHPRFTIGESTVPETTFGLRVLARRYDVPEIEYLATNGALRRHISTACGVKRNFGFVYHRDGEPTRPTECTQYPTWGPPLGPDSHYFRQDVDQYLFHLAMAYGATGLTRTMITDVELDPAGATIVTKDRGAFRADYIVDAGGIRSFLAEHLQLRQEPPYRTRSRTIYNHFVGVVPFDRVAPQRSEHGMPSPFSQGTLHHLFAGGWMWVIPFDNHTSSTNRLCSAGINLDLDRYPARVDVPPEQEFWEFVQRFPSVARQFADAKPVRPFVASARTQFSSRQVVGDRWCLLPHASDFIDPLFSSGLAVTVFALNALAHRLIDAVRERDFATERFSYLQTWIKRMFAYYDDLVSCSYISFDDFELWNAWNRVWTINTLYGTNAQNQAALAFDRTGDSAVFGRLERAPYRGLQGVDNEHCAALFERSVGAVRAYRAGEISSSEASRRIYGYLADSGLVPDVWGTLDPDDRCPAGTFTLYPMLRILRWGGRRSPAHVRGRYFTGGVRLVAKELTQAYRHEVVRDVTLAHQFMRDAWVNWNNDWKQPRGVRRDRASTVDQPAVPIGTVPTGTVPAAGTVPAG
jgi:FADH2 O2-dependent halogenase